jgi:hypothetical protein
VLRSRRKRSAVRLPRAPAPPVVRHDCPRCATGGLGAHPRASQVAEVHGRAALAAGDRTSARRARTTLIAGTVDGEVPQRGRLGWRSRWPARVVCRLRRVAGPAVPAAAEVSERCPHQRRRSRRRGAHRPAGPGPRRTHRRMAGLVAGPRRPPRRRWAVATWVRRVRRCVPPPTSIRTGLSRIRGSGRTASSCRTPVRGTWRTSSWRSASRCTKRTISSASSETIVMDAATGVMVMPVAHNPCEAVAEPGICPVRSRWKDAARDASECGRGAVRLGRVPGRGGPGWWGRRGARSPRPCRPRRRSRRPRGACRRRTRPRRRSRR